MERALALASITAVILAPAAEARTATIPPNGSWSVKPRVLVQGLYAGGLKLGRACPARGHPCRYYKTRPPPAARVICLLVAASFANSWRRFIRNLSSR